MQAVERGHEILNVECEEAAQATGTYENRQGISERIDQIQCVYRRLGGAREALQKANET